MNTWTDVLWTDWTTMQVDWSSIIDPFTSISIPPARMIDLGRVTSLRAQFEVTDVVGGATLFLVTSVSRSGPWSPVAEVDTSAFPATNIYPIRFGGGALTIANPGAPSVQANACGRYLGWTIRPPSGTTALCGITFKATVSYEGEISFGDEFGQGIDIVEVQPLIALGVSGAVHERVIQSAPAWLATSHWSELLLEVDVLLLTNAKLLLQTSMSGGPSDEWVDVVAAGITVEGRTTYLLNRDTTTSSANLLRNFFRWEAVQVVNPTNWECGLRITGNGR